MNLRQFLDGEQPKVNHDFKQLFIQASNVFDGNPKMLLVVNDLYRRYHRLLRVVEEMEERDGKEGQDPRG